MPKKKLVLDKREFLWNVMAHVATGTPLVVPMVGVDVREEEKVSP